MRDELRQYSLYELAAAATEKAQDADGGLVGNRVRDSDGKLLRTDGRELLDRKTVLFTIYEIGAKKSDCAWRNFAVEAYRAIQTMATFDQIENEG